MSIITIGDDDRIIKERKKSTAEILYFYYMQMAKFDHVLTKFQVTYGVGSFCCKSCQKTL